MSIESVMLSNHLFLCHPLLLLPSIFPSITVFSSESALCIWRPKYWSLSLILPKNIQGWFPLGLTGLITLLFKGLSRVFSSTMIRSHRFLALSLLLHIKPHNSALKKQDFSLKDMWVSYISRAWLWFSPDSKFQVLFMSSPPQPETVPFRLGREPKWPGLESNQNSTVFELRSHTWPQNLTKPGFLMSHHRKNSGRNKVIGERWIYLERNTLHRQTGPSEKGLSVFIRVGNFTDWWVSVGVNV